MSYIIAMHTGWQSVSKHPGTSCIYAEAHNNNMKFIVMKSLDPHIR